MAASPPAARDRAEPPPVRDARLRPAHEALARPGTQVLSLDVFDTLIWRRVREPVDAFRLVGAALRDRGLLASHVGPLAFGRLRERAEQRARVGRGEVTLAQVYAELAAGVLAEGAEAAAAEVEVEVERDLVLPDLDVADLLAAAAARGLRCVAVSDTYLAEDHVRRLLDHPALAGVELERVFVSSAYGTGKGQRLFGLVLEELGVPASAVVHVGDNPASDVEGARRAGITGVLFDRRSPELGRVLAREERWGGDPVHQRHGDFGLAALREKVAHRTEGEDLPGPERAAFRYGAMHLGPVLTGFAEWVCERAVAEGVPTVFGVMREGELLAGLVRTTAAGRGDALGAEPLWLSRVVAARAALDEVSRESLEHVMRRQVPPTVREFLATLGLEPGDVPRAARTPDARLTDRALALDLFAEVAASAELRGRVLEGAADLRRRLVRRVEAALPEGATTLVLCDLGWGGTIQAELDRALRIEGSPVRTLGLYLATTKQATDRVLDGSRIEGFLASCGLPSAEVLAIVRGPEVLEQVCMTDHGSLVDLDREGEPVLGPVVEPPAQAAQRRAAQAGIRAFAGEVARYRERCPGVVPPLQEAGEPLLGILTRAIAAPTREEAELFGRWVHDANFGSAASATLVGDEVRRLLRHHDTISLRGLPMRDVHWPFAAAALDDDRLAEQVAAVTLGRLPEEAFATDLETGAAEARWSGLGPAGTTVREARPRRNVRGLSHLRFGNLGGERLDAVRVHLVREPAVVRLDAVVLLCWRDGEPDAVRVVLDRPEALARIRLGGGARWLAPRALHLPGREAHLVLDVPALAGGPVHRADLELGFAVLGLDVTPGALAPARRRARDLAKRALNGAEYRTGADVTTALRGVAGRLRARLRR